MMGTEIRRAPNVHYGREEKSEALQKWIDMDVPAIAVSAVKGFVQHRPVLASFWILGLLIAAFAGGLPVDATSEEAYSHLLQQAELIDSRDLGQRAGVELAKAEAVYYQRKGWFGCDKWCQKAWDKVQMARAEVKRVQDHRDRVLSEGRREVGIWSSYGVKDIRRSFWSAWQSGKDFASRMTFYDVLFSVGSREESIYVMIFRWILQYLANLTFGLVGAFGFFLYNMYCLIVSYGASFFSGLAFFLLATVAGLSMLSTYLCSLYAVVAGGGVMIMQQAAKHAALEMNQQAAYQRIDAHQANRPQQPGLHRRRPE
mmetsp:Transcript_23310/g.50757  ORF Transcript_23310/g.50757 Transcript_23310/m.50757 type:complete len:314 (+) Transcript_23310:65-1006(+)